MVRMNYMCPTSLSVRVLAHHLIVCSWLEPWSGSLEITVSLFSKEIDHHSEKERDYNHIPNVISSLRLQMELILGEAISDTNASNTVFETYQGWVEGAFHSPH